MPILSAIVITRNEAGNIAACVDGLAFCDECIVVDGASMKHFVNGVYENAGPCPGAEGCTTTQMLTTPYPLAYQPIGAGGTSLGCRYTQEAFLNGAIRMARFTPRALLPTEFLPPPAH